MGGGRAFDNFRDGLVGLFVFVAEGEGAFAPVRLVSKAFLRDIIGEKERGVMER
jgi:hypothetical protein